jgi:hypothetical protein
MTRKSKTEALPMKAKEPAIIAILEWLVDKYGEPLGLPKWGASRLVAELADKSGMTEPGIRNLINGRTKKAAQIETCNKLQSVFKSEIPHLQARWFQVASLDEFIDRIEHPPPNRRYLKIGVPWAGYRDRDKDDTFDNLARWLKGVYVCYRYSFSRSADRGVAREVLWVRMDGEREFLFRMSFLRDNSDESSIAETFEGIVLPLGQSIFFAGWDMDRGRALFMRRSFENEMRECRFAILSSTRESGDFYPVAACTVLIKAGIEETEENVLSFMRDATCIRPLDEMISADFGAEHVQQMSTLLDNSPLSVRADNSGVAETVLRVNLDRFRGWMPAILQNAKSTANGPFKKGWKPLVGDLKDDSSKPR